MALEGCTWTIIINFRNERWLIRFRWLVQMLIVYFVSTVCWHYYLVIDIKHRKLPNKPPHSIQTTRERERESERKKGVTSKIEQRRFVLFAHIASAVLHTERHIPFSIGLGSGCKLTSQYIYSLFDQMLVMLCNVPIYLHLFQVARTLSFLFVNIFWLIQQTV